VLDTMKSPAVFFALMFVCVPLAGAEPCPWGDISGDCKVDRQDLVLFCEQWLELYGCEPGPGSGCADLDGINRVDMNDLNLLARDWGRDERQLGFVINEFMAINDETFGTTYQQGGPVEYPDWIEIRNPNDTAVSVDGLYLTDDADDLTKWALPAVTIDSNDYLVICASGLDFLDPNGYYHTNFKLSGAGEYLALVGPGGNKILHEYAPQYPSQVDDVSYGLYDGEQRYFATPTPGADNNDAYLGLVADTEFSHNRGFYDAAFDVIVATTTNGATIKYTLDGTEPSLFHSNTYSGPVHVSTTTCLRAMALKEGYRPSNVDTHTYIFLDDVIDQSNDQSARGMPSTWVKEDGWSRPADYAMDPEITGSGEYSGLMRECLTSIPTLSIAMNVNDLFDQYDGIYSNANRRHVLPYEDWERACSAEFFDANGTENMQVDCAIRAHGDLARVESVNHKHPLRLLFKGDYGPGRLNYPFFKDSDQDSYNTIVLRATYGGGWGAGDSGADYVRNRFSHNLLGNISDVAPEGKHVHLYLNGVYWGLYNPEERPDDVFSADHFGGDPTQWDVIKGGCVWDGSGCDWQGLLHEGSKAAYDAMIGLCPKFSGEADMEHTLDDVSYNLLCEYLDIEQFIDYLIVHMYVHSYDWPQKNWYATCLRDPDDPGAPPVQKFRYFTWDMESNMGWHEQDLTRVGDSDYTRMGPGRIHKVCRLRPDYQRTFGDRVHRAMFNDGGLLMAKNSAEYSAISDEIYTAIIGESARWGDNRVDYYGGDTVYTRNDHWLPRIDYANGTGWYGSSYIGLRNDILLSQFRASNLYPNTDAPVFNVNGGYKHGGQISASDQITMTGTGGMIFYTVDGNDILVSEEVPPITYSTLIAEDDAKKVLVPTSNIGTSWKGGSEPYDDSWWNSGTYVSGKTGGVGYDNNPDYLPYITYDVKSEMSGVMGSCYVRVPFTVDSGELEDYTVLKLKLRYDDGFVAYINGVEVERENAPESLYWDSEGQGLHNDSAAVVFQDFYISSHISNLHAGTNILAIQGLNSPKTSSDFLISVELEAATGGAGDVNMSPGTVEYSGAFTLPNSSVVKARALEASEWSALNEAVYSVGPVAESLRVSELMYHPKETDPPDDPNAEYIELTNIGGGTINLNLVRFTDGIDFAFGPDELAPGQRILVVKSKAAFEAKYGTGRYIAGEYASSLANGGERIRLRDAIGTTITDFRYSDGWRETTDGAGYSLTIINPANPDPNSWNAKDSWRPSAYIGGSPGWDDSGIVPNPSSIVINEVMAHTDSAPNDWIELYNTTASPIDISGWYLSDNLSDVMKYEFGPGTVIGAYDYLVVSEDANFGTASTDPGKHVAFALSENGELVRLCSALDANGVLTGYHQTEDFGASENGVSFGRYYKASTDNFNFVPMSSPTAGAANAYPKLGPVVITEIMYHPDWYATGWLYDNDQYEYIELYNPNPAGVTLYDYGQGEAWKFVDGIDYTFPSPPDEVTIPAGEYIVVVKNSSAFALRYSSVPLSKVFGPYDGWLANDGEKIELAKPGDEYLGTRYYIRVERVNYSDGLHPGDNPSDVDLWPTAADGQGSSLERIDISLYANDPNNWIADTPSPGS